MIKKACNIHTQANECNYRDKHHVVSSDSTSGIEAPCEVSAQEAQREEVHHTVGVISERISRLKEDGL